MRGTEAVDGRDDRSHLAVLGSPIEHSKSPALHAAAYRVLDLDWSYGRHELDAARLEGFLADLGPAWRGLSLTMPLKHRALELVDHADRAAHETGAVNTLRFGHTENGSRRVEGFNTDVGGIVRAIGAAGVDTVTAAVVLGGGATASSAVMAVAELGAQEVHVALRTPAQAQPLQTLAEHLGLRFGSGPIDGRMPDAPLVISTLPGGALTEPGPVLTLAPGGLLLDVAYDPWPSALATAWSAAGGSVLSGLSMLVHQALLQVRIFVDGDPSVPLDDEPAVLSAMLAAVDLDAAGTPVDGSRPPR
jgi:shikimate dehydrogenase